MKNRSLSHSDDWATPPAFLRRLVEEYGAMFDPCPYGHDTSEWNGLDIEWQERNFINPPYSRLLKEAFVLKGVEQAAQGKICVFLLPVSTSTRLFHETILPNAKEIRYVRGRIPFIGINTKGEYVNWHLWDRKAPEGAVHVRNSGMHDSMLVVF